MGAPPPIPERASPPAPSAAFCSFLVVAMVAVLIGIACFVFGSVP